MPGNKLYTIQYAEIVVRSHIPALPLVIKKRIKRAIEDRLMIDPLDFGKPLQHSFKGYRRLRVGDYRIIYRIEQSSYIVVIVAIKHRKEAYSGVAFG